MPANIDHQKYHLFEKIQVQVLTVALGLVVFFGIWPLMAPRDSLAPMILLSGGSLGAPLSLLTAVAVLSLLAGAVTVHQRPVGGLMVSILSLLALSFRSEKINVLLFRYEQHPGSAYPVLMGELLLLLVAAGVGVIAAGIGRSLVAGSKPAWRWQPRHLRKDEANFQADQRSPLGLAAPVRKAAGSLMDKSDPAAGNAAKLQFVQAGRAILVCFLVANAILLLLCRSDERGQLLFAVGGAFLIASLAANLVAPSRLVVLLLPLPILSGLFYYGYAMATAGQGLQAWANIWLPARILPIDWLSAGVGGVLTGYWIACRIREAKFAQDSQDSGGSAKAAQKRQA